MYDRGYRRGGYETGDWSDPYQGAPGVPYDRGGAGERPWVGSYRRGYEGGSGGIPTGARPLGYDRDWWLGGHRPGRYGGEYEREYREFDRLNHPRFSPVGGTYPAMGGSCRYGALPRPLRDDLWFSDWTRWF
ncbi:MAG TPA: hypothetical protein VFL93_10920 [Longimicrobiaceae bacterium]|jgi:hypothetical protein|nr:hypothetical protein [Longimicrobiaceae bacterium]